EEEDPRLERERKRDVEELLVAVREVARGRAGPVRELEERHDLPRAADRVRRREAPQERGAPSGVREDARRQRLLDREAREEARHLEGADDAATHDLDPVFARNVLAIEDHTP